MWWGLLAAATFGISTPLSKILLDRFSAFQLAGLLYLGAALGVAPFAVKRREWHRFLRMDRKNTLRIGGAVGFGGIIGPLFLLLALRRASASSVSLWLNLELAATAVLGAALFRDRLSARGWLSVAGVMLAGVLVALPEGVSGTSAALWTAGACLAWGFDNHLTSLVDDITPAQSTFIKGIIAGGVNLLAGLTIRPDLPGALHVFAALGIGAASFGASIAMYITAAQHMGATRSQTVFASAPFFGASFSVIILSEAVTALQLFAASIIIASIFLLHRSRHTHPHEHSEMEHVHLHSHEDEHHDHQHDSRLDASHAHIHRHRHRRIVHNHAHFPDLHHHHDHRGRKQ